jgi:hypothetical protein
LEKIKKVLDKSTFFCYNIITKEREVFTMKKVIIKNGRREFQCTVDFEDARYGCCRVTIREIIHPNRKFLKTEFFGESYMIYIADYDSIMEAIEEKVEKYIEEQEFDDKIIQKIREFENIE